MRAISWHLAAALKLDEKKMRRITFNEITKNAIKASLKAPQEIDMDLVDAQQAPRPGSYGGIPGDPLLWAKVEAWSECRTCSVCGASDHCGPGSADRRIYTGRILDAGCCL